MLEQFEVNVPKSRYIELDNGNKIKLTHTDPYGLISLSLEKGTLPDNLKDQQFTEWRYAIAAAESYAKAHRDAIKDIKDYPYTGVVKKTEKHEVKIKD